MRDLSEGVCRGTFCRVARIGVRGIAARASRREQRLYAQETSLHSEKFRRWTLPDHTDPDGAPARSLVSIPSRELSLPGARFASGTTVLSVKMYARGLFR